MDPYCDTGKTCLGRGMHCPTVMVCFSLSYTVFLFCKLASVLQFNVPSEMFKKQ